MTAGKDAHAAFFRSAVIERYPGPDDVVGMVAPVQDILVVADEIRLVGILHHDCGVPDQDIGADEGLDGLQYNRVSNQGIGPGERHVDLEMKQQIVLGVTFRSSQIAFEPMPDLRHLSLRHDPDRAKITVPVVNGFVYSGGVRRRCGQIHGFASITVAFSGYRPGLRVGPPGHLPAPGWPHRPGPEDKHQC